MKTHTTALCMTTAQTELFGIELIKGGSNQESMSKTNLLVAFDTTLKKRILIGHISHMISFNQSECIISA